MITSEFLEKLINGHLAETPVFLAEVTVKPGNRINVYIDGDQGVTIETCRELNQFLNTQLDRDQEDYDLTVSSYGADRPLRLQRQYRKNTGKSLEIATRDGEKFTGKVLNATDESVEMEVAPAGKRAKGAEPRIVILRYTDITKAKEVITFKP